MSSTHPDPSAPAPRLERRRHRGWRVAWRVAFATVFAAWSLLLLAWLTLQWGIVPRVGQWKPQIEQRASAALGVPVTIGAIRVQSSGWMPLIELDDVVLAPRSGATPSVAGEALRLPNAGSGEALRLPRVSATLSARSLLGWQLRFEQLHVDGAALEVRRDVAGRLFVAGIELRAGPTEDGSAGTDWLLAQHEIAVRNGRLRWIDEQRAAPPLELSAVDLVLRNGLAGHELRLDATPPSPIGQRFTLQGEFRQPLLAQRSDWRRWSGTAFAELPQADAAALRPWLPALPVEVPQGEGALRAWVEVAAGEVKSVQADLALRQVQLRFPGRTAQALPFERLQGRVSAAREGRTLRFAAEQLSFASGNIDWPATRWNLALRERAGAGEPVAAAASSAAAPSFDGGEFSADRLDIDALATLAAQLPLGEAVKQLLAELAPSGQVNNLSARWDGPLDAPRTYTLKAQASALSIAAKPAADANRLGRPGWRNATLDIEASDSGGRAQLALNKGALIFPGLFERPEVAFDSFGTRLAWRLTPQAAGAPSAIDVTATDTQFANADAQGQLGKAVWRSGAGAGFARGGRFPGQLDLSAQLARGRATAVARYLPLGLPDTRRYLERAVRDGRVASAAITVKGDLFDFPFVPYTLAGQSQPVVPSGEFRVSARVEDGELAYVPAGDGEPAAWPAFSRVAGELLFDRNTMEIRNAQARLWGVELSKVNGGFRDLRKPVLKIDGEARGPLSDMLRYVNSSPVGGWTGNALRGATASGAAELKLALELPIAELERSTVQGTVQLAGNDVRLTRETPLLAAAKARISFSQKGFSVAGATARVLGGEATFDGGTQQDGGLRFNGQGVVTAEALRGASELGALAKLAASASGQTPYRLALGFVRGRSEFTLTSPLTGLALNLPAPLTKAADTSWPLRVETRVAADGLLRDSLRVELNDVPGPLQTHLLSALYQRDLSRDDGVPVVMRGAIGVLEAAPSPPERGVHAVLALGAVDGDAWQAVLDRAPSPGAAPVQGAVALPAAGRAINDAGGYLPRVIALRAQSVVSGGRRLNQLVLGISQDSADGTWRGNIDAEQMAGYVEYRASAGTASPGRVHARLTRLALPPAEASTVETLLAEAPATVPALDIVIDNFELRGKKLGRVELEGVNRGAREWRLNKLALTTPEAQLSGSGQWQAGASPRMVMDFKLDLADSGAFMERLGFAGTLRGGKGRVAGQVSWAGSPLAFHLPSLDGKLNIALDNGQFLKAGPGAARLFSVLSLQSLPRRLMLDFRDVFQEGFAFDNVAGDVTIDDGVAATRNLRLRGVQAAVLMEGNADLQRETQDLRVVVVPEINAGTASLAYAVINPAVGLGSFIAQLFLRRPLMAASTREFTVQGSWAEPKVERVERKLDAPLPDFEIPAAASSPRGPS